MTMTAKKYRETRIQHWDTIANQKDLLLSKGKYYHERLSEIYRFIIPQGCRVIEFGCGFGDLLASLNPSYGVGVDFSGEMIGRAKQMYPDIRFVECDIHDLGNIKETFDFVILSDVVNDLWDVQTVFDEIKSISNSKTRIIINSYSRVWELPLKIAQRLGYATKVLPQNWLTVEDLTSLLNLADFEVIRHWPEILLPLKAPVLSKLCNRFLAKLWPFRYFALSNFIIARPRPPKSDAEAKPRVSVIIPARNEEGHISEILKRVPEMGESTELIFVEGNSTDNTYAVIEQAIAESSNRKCKLFKQKGVGKGDAVRLGFANAEGGILMILDADLTVPPEDLPRFYEALVSGKGEFINGVRLVYPMEKQAMRFLNFLGNKFFSLVFSWLLGQPIKDTLCGTKVLWKDDYDMIANNRSYFGDFDPFGDFDLIFGSAKLNFKIIDLPIRYKERKYGTTNISRWSHGFLLLRMMFFAAGRVKFI